jgi:hypothetical protein
VSAEETVAEFGVWGGVPRYWEIRARSNSFEEAVKNHVLDQHGILYKVIFLKRPEKCANEGSAMVISPEQVIRRSL